MSTKTLFLMGALTTIFLSASMTLPSEDSQSAITKTVTVEKPLDIETIVRSSISSTQTQNQLLVLTARMNAVSTSTIQSMGMEAWQINVATGEAQYLLNLAQLKSSNFLIDKQDITVAIPMNAMVVKQLPVVYEEEKDNDSWLFTFDSDIKEKLRTSNQQRIKRSFIAQAQEQKAQAYINAKQSLTSLLEASIRAAGLPHRIHIVFK